MVIIISVFFRALIHKLSLLILSLYFCNAHLEIRLNYILNNCNICCQVKSSGQMEVNAAERLLKYLVSCGLNIRVFATDRSTSVRTMMAKVFPWIRHQFDIWETKWIYIIIFIFQICRHFSKGINKRLFKSFKLKSCPNLKVWQKSVTNMVWWSISSSIGKMVPENI